MTPQSSTLSSKQATSARRPTLLIVDDDEGPRKSLEMIFRSSYQVLAASSGYEALDLLNVHAVDVAILDIRMQGMSGIELLEKLKAKDPSIEAMMLTGYETVETIRQALRFGACDYLSKPYDVETIRAAVSNAMERRTFAEELRSTNQKMTSLQIELQQHSIDEEITRNRGEIYASILHDINGPLTIIGGYVQLINSDLEAAQRLDVRQIQELKDQLRLINRQVTHCIDISQRYLSFLRRRPSEKQTALLSKAFEDVSSLLKGHPSRSGHQFSVNCKVDDLVAAINGAELVQILLNLTINGFQSTALPHTVRMNAERVESLNVADIDPGAYDRYVVPDGWTGSRKLIKLTVADDGPGIPSHVLARLFEPYFTTKSNSGTGLGLCIVQRLVKNAGGILHVHSHHGAGTSFNIYLPAVEAAVAAAFNTKV